MPCGISTENAVFSGKGPGKMMAWVCVRLWSSPDFGFQLFPPASLRTISLARLQGAGAENVMRMGSTGMQPPPFFSRGQENSARKGGRAWNSRTWSSSVSTPLRAAMPLPQTSRTFADGGKACLARRATSVPSSFGIRRALRSCSRSLSVTRVTPTRSLTPATENQAFFTIVSGTGFASRVSTKICLSSMAVSPS